MMVYLMKRLNRNVYLAHVCNKSTIMYVSLLRVLVVIRRRVYFVMETFIRNVC